MNKYNPNIHQRRSIRLKGYDYSQAGLYFITICVQHRECLFGEIVGAPLVGAQMQLNDAGMMVENEWLKLSNRFENIQLHEFVVMPNHFHAILEIVGAPLVGAPNESVTQNDGIAQNDGIMSNYGIAQNDGIMSNDGMMQNDGMMKQGQPQGIAPTVKNITVGDMVGAFQSIVTVEYIRGVKTLGWPPFAGKLWQRNYWEHIIRNEQSYQRIANYIINNPAKWEDDKFYRQ